MKSGKKLTIITSNKGKFEEYKKELSGYTEVERLDIEYPEIQSDSLKRVVEFALDQLIDHKPVMIDDSGLFIDGLNGFPGVYSAYVMDTLGCEGILRLMDEIDDRGAAFRCIIGLIDEDGDRSIFEGNSEGTITREMKGEHGFGYDPIFQPQGKRKTFAQMNTSEKNTYSHRGKASAKLIDNLDDLDLG